MVPGVRAPRLWRRCRRLLNYLGSIVVLVWITTSVLLRDSIFPSLSVASGFGPSSSALSNESSSGDRSSSSASTAGAPYTVPPRFEKYLADVLPDRPPGVKGNFSNSSFAGVNETLGRVMTIREIDAAIDLINSAQVIHNEVIFGPVSEDTIVFVVQVHSRAEYLKHLIVSFAAASGIEDALIVFSHDLYDPGINELIGRIDFCRYAQIFFPLSIQTHPDRFPGDDPRDCPPDMKRAAAEKLGCLNARWPDKFGHYRQAKLSQIKHHWWWKAWYLFEGGFRPLEGFKGDVIFLEEDHWVVEDIIPVYRLVKSQSKTWCPECAFISLGNQMKKQDRAGNQVKYRGRVVRFPRRVRRQSDLGHDQSPPGQVEISQWISSKHNMGMAFGRSSWDLIKGCSKQFCLFDDYNWDWSLMYIGMTCTQPKLMTLSLKSSRVFHIGECGIHHKKKSCDVIPVLRRVQAQVKAYGDLHPTSLTFRRATYKVKAPKGNGGWGDYRDRALCLNLTSPDFISAS